MPAPPTVRFLGAAGTVTGSMHLVSAAGRRVLLDAGLFQGLKDLRLRNWGERVGDPASLDAVVLSHAHLDHSGYLPLLVRRGFRGPIHCTPATADLLRVMLQDSARLLEEEADRANRHEYSKHQPALPLYTVDDALATQELLEPRPYRTAVPVAPGMTATLRRAGHILGAASVELAIGATRLAFSGDVGRWGRPILHDPEPIPAADVLLLESTYGDRTHPTDADETVTRVVREAARRGGAVVVPAFALGRTQELIWLLERLEAEDRIPALPIYVDSPMAIDVNEIYLRHPDEQDAAMRKRAGRGGDLLRGGRTRLARSVEASKAVNAIGGPVIIIAASGMATGGRVLHHLALRLPDARSTVLLVGFQAAGTRGRALRDGARELRIFGRDVPVRATVETLDGLSAHADREELLRWLGGFEQPPRDIYLVHGEPAPATSLAEAIRQRYGGRVRPAVDGETVEVA